jgi:hypothetical protein
MYTNARRLSNQFDERRANPIRVPKMVEKKIPITDTSRVLIKPTRNA